ncbi:MAG: DUF3567 domain-containing protein [Burkholderiaceae bacterium]|nr:DUF3567 domain-containing protein [Burkholderiaceae bacterium]
MNMLYNSDNYTVVQFVVPDEAGPGAAHAAGRGGYEIVDKFARKEIFIDGALAESFKAGVQALIENSPTEEAIDEFIGRYVPLMQQPLVLH